MNIDLKTHPLRKHGLAFLAAVLFLAAAAALPAISALRHPTLYIASSAPVLEVSSPYIYEGEVEESVHKIPRGSAVRLESRGKTASEVSWNGQLLTIPNENLVSSLEEVVTLDTVFPRTLVYLQQEKNGPLSEVFAVQGEPLHVVGFDPADLSSQTGEIAWLQVEKDGQTYYVNGRMVEDSQEKALGNGGETAMLQASLQQSESSQTYAGDLKGWTQPNWPDNPVQDQRLGVQLSLASLFNYKDQLIELKNSSNLDTLVVSLQAPDGAVWFENQTDAAFYNNPEAAAQRAFVSAEEVAALVQEMKDAGFTMAARLNTFQNSSLANDRVDLAILNENGEPALLDNTIWLSPYSRTVWNYYASLAKEAAGLGFSEIQFDEALFPGDLPSGQEGSTYTVNNIHNETRSEAIAAFLTYMRQTLEDLHVYTGTDISALALDPAYGLESGQYLPALSKSVNVLAAQGYLSALQNLDENYGREVYSNAYDVSSAFAGRVLSSNSGRNNARSAMWVEGFGLMSPETLKNQIDGARSAQMQNILVWSEGGNWNTLYPLIPAFQ